MFNRVFFNHFRSKVCTGFKSIDCFVLRAMICENAVYFRHAANQPYVSYGNDQTDDAFNEIYPSKV